MVDALPFGGKKKGADGGGIIYFKPGPAGPAFVTQGEAWPDGTPIWRGPAFDEPWGSHPRDRWVRLMAEIASDGVWDVRGSGCCCDELPVSGALVRRIRAWQEWHDDEDERAWTEPAGRGAGGPFFHWEQHPGKPVAAFNAEGRAIGRALKAALPTDWTVLVQDLDAWLRESDRIEDWCLILRPE